MPNVEMWYLTKEGWLRSSVANQTAMVKGQNVFRIVKAGRNGFCNSASVAWDCAACDLNVEQMEDHLLNKFGEWPGELTEWYAAYSGPTF
jgi:hypothetical protein